MEGWCRLDRLTSPVHSGRAGADRSNESRGRCRRSGRRDGCDRKRLLEDVFHKAGEVAALSDDGDLQFPPERVAGHDAEVAADVGDDGADRLAADHRVKPGGMLCGDHRVKPGGKPVQGGQVYEAGVGFVRGGRGGWPGCARRPPSAHPHRDCFASLAMTAGIGFASQSNNALD
jgi:hypothetical protein